MALESPTLFKRKNLLAALAVASVLLLGTGCAPEVGVGGTAGGSAGGSNSGSTDGSTDGNPDGTKGDEDSDSSKDGDDKASGNLTGTECLPGNWIMDNSTFEDLMNSMSDGASVKTSGLVILTFHPDGKAQTNYDHWTNTIKLPEATSVVERHGIDKGTYTAAASGAMTMSDSSIGSVTTMTATVLGGKAMTMAVDPEPSVFSQAKYACSGEVLTVTAKDYDLILYREH